MLPETNIYIKRRELSVFECKQRPLRQTFLSRGANYQSMNVSNAILQLTDIFILRRGLLVFECKQRRLGHTFLS